MAARHIYEHNIPELEYCYGKLPVSSGSTLSPLLNTRHPDFGAFNVSNLVMPQMFILDMHWNIPDELVIHESHPSDTVDVSFVLEGNIRGKYRGLGADFGMRGGTNNLKYTPYEKSSHHAVKQDAKIFVISLDKSYFRELIGHDNPWAEGVQNKMEKGENFLASTNFLTTTPQMHSLIHAIRNMQNSPTSRLLTQSLIFQLLACQVAQLQNLHAGGQAPENISVNDIEKLHLIKQHIELHFLEDLTLSGLCRVGMLNEFKLKKGFKALFGTSVIHYAKQLRMQYAQTLLREHRMNIEEVSGLLGYQYPNHFSVAYKKHFGMVPSAR
jgi:AraC family transcriptional regulator, transcriptional activator of the genes for pyochelin and ferripyochelin receptors